MSFRNVQGNSLQNFRTLKPPILGRSSAATYSADGAWVRNPTWLPLASIDDTMQKFTGLYRVDPRAAFIAVNFSTSAGQYQVDWGDGTVQTFNSGTQANYQYDFADADLVGTDGPVTFTASGSTVDRTAHGYQNGYTVSFAEITTTTGISVGQIYYVVNATANTFQVSATMGGSAITLTNNGSGKILPYRQAVVTVTPVTGGATLTTVNLGVRHNQTNLQTYSTGWLDIAVSAGCTTLTLGATTVTLRNLQQANILKSNTTTFNNLFANCNQLEHIVGVSSLATVTVTSSMFSGCFKLASVPLFDTSAVTDMSSMFASCSNLRTVPLFNTQSATSMASMFFGCSYLETVPLFETDLVTNMSAMFQDCGSLATIPQFNTVSVTTMLNMFRSCASLVTIPPLNTPALTNCGNMFDSCISLVSVPLFDTNGVTVMNTSAFGMFRNCSSLASVPLFDMSAVANLALMFQGCVSLTSVPLFNTSAATNMSSFLSGCTSLLSCPAFNTSSVVGTTTSTGLASMLSGCSNLMEVGAWSGAGPTASGGLNNIFGACPSLTRIQATGFRFTFTVANCKLGPAQLDEIYTNLPTVTAQTITVSGNWGIASDTPSIATAKGWTVTGS